MTVAKINEDVVVNDLSQITIERITGNAKYRFVRTVQNGELTSVSTEVMKPIQLTTPEGEITEYSRLGDIIFEYGSLRISQFPFDENVSQYITDIKNYIDSIR